MNLKTSYFLSNATLFHFIDFEGTVQDGIVEYGIVTGDMQGIHKVYTRLCKPKKIGLYDRQLHGISDEVVEKVEPIDTDWALFSALRKQGVFVAHNASVEDRLIRSVWPFCSKSTDWVNGGETVEWGPWLDTCRLYNQCAKNLKNYKLETLVEECGLGDELKSVADSYCPKGRKRWHCALFDALACYLIFQYLVRNIDS